METKNKKAFNYKRFVKQVSLKFFKHFFIWFFIFITIIPIVWAFITSLKPIEDILSYPPIIFSKNITLDNFVRVLTQNNFITYTTNSIIVTFFTILLTIIVSLLAGYAADRYEFPGKGFLMFLILSGMSIGRFANVIPMYFLSNTLNLYNTYTILILSYSAFITPIVTWLMQSYYKNIPRAMEEAAKIDGCNTWTTFWWVVIPMMKPPIIAGVVIAMTNAWNEFILALTLTNTTEMRTLSVGLKLFMTDYGVDWSSLTAASVLSILPIVIVFLLLQKYFVQGFSSGSLSSS